MKTITIAGGGLAGLALGIHLRRRRVPVVLYESGRYPRHRVCGEFISGRGVEILEELHIPKIGGYKTRQARFFSQRASGVCRLLPQPALCISRWNLDAALAEAFQASGGELRSGCRWSGDSAEGLIRATGRRLERTAGQWRWYGLKAHASGVSSTSDLEMHLLPHGYIGLTRLDARIVNVCGLFRTRCATRALAGQWREWLRGPPGSTLRRRMEQAVFLEETFCAVAGLSIASRPQTAACSLGDTIGMIAPLSGNGMSMALESAKLAAEPLACFARGEISWSRAQAHIARLHHEAFSRRLRIASWLQRLSFTPCSRDALLFATSRCTPLWRFCYHATH